MIIGISQSNYIPWKGYFDFIDACDVFVLYDIVQYTKNDWRNRNKIVTNNNSHWLTIPVQQKKLQQVIQETKIADSKWNKQHWKSIKQAYSSSANFTEVEGNLEELYLKTLEQKTNLSKVNEITLKWWLKHLNITTQIISSQSLDSNELIPLERSERLLKVCKDLNATSYKAQPMGKSYLNTSLFNEANIKVDWMEYNNYSNRNSIIDVTFSECSQFL